jgi:hypothetical protein
LNGSAEQAVCGTALRLWKGSGKRISLTVETGSMAPMIRPGDAVEIAMLHADQARPGDIVAFLQNGHVIVHRLIKHDRSVYGRRLWQRGDSLFGWGFFDECDFIGKVAAIRRGSSVLNMDRAPWRLLNRFLGLAGRVRMEALEAARWVRQTWR